MGLEKQIDNNWRRGITETVPLRIDQSYMEWSILKLFSVDVRNMIEVKAVLGKNFHIQPSEFDKMPFWEYELYIMAMNDMVKEENEKQKAEMDKYGLSDVMHSAIPKNLARTTQSMMPKTPDFGAMKAPTFKF